MLLCHLLHTYCLPILLYGLEAVSIFNANRQTLYVTWKTALNKIFRLNDEVNLLYVQYCLGILLISYVFDLRRLCFLFKQSTYIISVHNIFTMCLVFEFNKLYSVYSVGKLSHGHFKACVWYAFYVCIT